MSDFVKQSIFNVLTHQFGIIVIFDGGFQIGESQILFTTAIALHASHAHL